MGLRGSGGISSKGRPVRLTLALLVAPVLAGCAHALGPRPTPTNPAGFPLYPGSTVLSVRAWNHALSPSERSTLGIFDTNENAYAGHDVVTATQASFDELVAWLQALDAHPPQGYRVGVWGNGLDDARAQARAAGVDFAAFDRGAHDVLVIVVDPVLLQRKAGFMLSAISRFRYLPAFVRAPIDAQARAQTGFTVSEAVDPTTPIGAAVDALGRLNDARSRGIIFIDARPAR